MELPTYTSIWRIEKRLYKLYDFRLPMPLPVGQIAVFATITVPYIILLRVFGLPFTHSLFWLYVLPPGVLTWLATRPVLESKRLPELIQSQLRYLGEPTVWCRMAPLAEKDEITVVGRVWLRARPFSADRGGAERKAKTMRGRLRSVLRSRRAAPVFEPGVQQAAAVAAQAAIAPAAPWASQAPPRRHTKRATGPAGSHPVQRAAEAAGWQAQRATEPARPAQFHRATEPAVPTGRQAAEPRVPTSHRAAEPRVPTGRQAAERAVPTGRQAAEPAAPLVERPAEPAAERRAEPAAERPAEPAAERVSPPASPPPRPVPEVVVVPAQRSVPDPDSAPQVRPAPSLERALSGPGEHRAGWRGHVSIVPGGRGPGRPDQQKRAKARAVLPVDGPRLVVVLGCTVGAGQTVTTLMLADLLSSLRGEPVAALDLNAGPASLTELARVPAISVSDLLAGRAPASPATHRGHAGRTGRGRGRADSNGSRGRLDVICDDATASDGGAARAVQHGRLLDVLASRYSLTLADPGAPAVAKLLAAADQLVLVAPSSPDAARALGMTLEWLGAHGYNPLIEQAITVINGVSQRSTPHADQAVAVVSGRCRAIVRVPWDDHLAEPETERGIRDSLAMPGASRLRQLRPAVQQAYTALAGVLVRQLAAGQQERRAAP